MGAQAGMIMQGTGAFLSGGAKSIEGQQTNYSMQYKAQVARNNAALARQYAQMEVQKGNQQGSMVRARGTAAREGAATKFAAGNLSTAGNTSAGKVLESIDHVTNLDVLTIRNNAARSAWAHNVKATDYEAQADVDLLAGEQAEKSGNAGAVASLLSGGGMVAEKWANYQPNREKSYTGGGDLLNLNRHTDSSSMFT